MGLIERLAQDWRASGEACAFLAHMAVFLACCVLRLVAVGCATTFAIEGAARGLSWVAERSKARRKAKSPPPAASAPVSRGPTSWTN